MMTDNELSTFNAAVSSEDWPLVKVLGEAALAQGAVSPLVKYNLALAYYRAEHPGMAVALLVSTQENGSGKWTSDLIRDAMAASGVPDDIAGKWDGTRSGILAPGVLAERRDAMSATASGCFLLAVLLYAVARFWRVRLARVGKILAPLAGVFAAVGAMTLALYLGAGWYKTRWAAVIEKSGAVIRSDPSDNSAEMARAAYGYPLIVTGDARGAWVFVSDLDGKTGWVSAGVIRVAE